MRYIGIDYGTQRVGVAVSDDDGRIAFPKKILFNSGTSRLVKEIKALCKEQPVEAIVVGLPMWGDGGKTDLASHIKIFGQLLGAATGCLIQYQNEILSSREARALKKKDQHIDQVSAALILQAYLDNRGTR